MPSWTVLGAAGAPGTLAVDPAGRIVTGRTGWTLTWEVGAGTRRYLPADHSTLRQRPVGAERAAAVGLETVLRAEGGEVSQRVYVCLPPGGGIGALGVLEVRNDTSAPVAVTLALLPGDFRRPDGLWRLRIDAEGAEANGAPALWWERAPATVTVTTEAGSGAAATRERAEPAGTGAVGTDPTTATVAEATRAIAGDTGAASDGTATAEATRTSAEPIDTVSAHGPPPALYLPQRVRSRRGTAGATMTWPVTHGTALRVLVPLDGADEAARPAQGVLPSLAQVGRGWEAHTARGLRVAGLGDPNVAAVADAAVRRLLALDIDAPGGLDGPFSPAERALVAVALAVAGFGDRAAEVLSLRAARRPDVPARLAAREAVRIAASWGVGPAVVGAMAAGTEPGGGWATERAGDDPICGAAFLLALRDALVQERDGCLDLLPGADEGGPIGLADTAAGEAGRPPVEVHKLRTRWGVLSFALRWHGATPALLWELVPPGNRLETWAASLAAAAGADPAGPVPPRLTIGVLAPNWSSHQLTGETLLAL